MTIEYLLLHYWENGESTVEIAKQCNVHPNSVRRQILKFWGKLRSKKEAQELFLQKNEHQRVGSSHSEETKKQISLSLKEEK